MFSVLRDHASGERSGTSIGPTVAADALSAPLRSEICRMVQPRSRAYTKSMASMGGDGTAAHRLHVQPGAQRDAGEDHQFGTRVEAVHVFAGIGFGISDRLCVAQHVGKGSAAFHAAENVVAGAVEDAFDARDAIARQSLLQAGDDWYASGDSRAVEQMRTFGASEAVQFDAMLRDEFLVAGDGGFSGSECAANPRPRRLKAAS